MRRASPWIVALLLVSLTVLSACSMPRIPSVAAQQETESASAGTVAALEGALEEIYIQVNPSVVNIQVLYATTGASTAIPEIPGLPFDPSVPQMPQPQGSLGSGFVWDNEGRIVTNNHVVEGADRITVTFYDGTTRPARILGADADSDLAVLQLDLPPDRLRPIQTADSTQINVGELVVALGNPFGLEGTMTVGIVSALGRSLPVLSDLLQGPVYTIPDIIQTDAPINPGNSGGVLLDDTGKLVGVTAAIESPVRANAGIGFAIPSVIVQKVVPALIDTGSYEHPWLGISGVPLMPELAAAMDLDPDQRGTLVLDVTEGGPADEAGLRGSERQVEIEGQPVRVGGDVIIAVDGEPVRDFDDLITYLARYTEVGQTIYLRVLRGEQEQTLSVTLEPRPEAQTPTNQPQGRAERGAYLGIVGLTVTPEIAEAMDLPADQEGVLVAQVLHGSPAGEAGLRESEEVVTINGQQLLIGGDIIVAVDDTPVATFQDLRNFMQQAEPDQEVSITLSRDGAPVIVDVVLGERPMATS